MNFLGLVRELAEKASVSGTPSAVTNQVGEMARLVTWINQAWVELQKEHIYWNFLWSDAGALSTVPGTKTYAEESDCNTVIGNSMFVSDGVNPRKVSYLDYKTFIGLYRNGTATGIPQYFTERPDGKLQFYPIPDAVYSVTYEYYKSPTELSASTDIPNIPSEFHRAIVYKALVHYGEYEEDADVTVTAAKNYSDYLSDMELELLPEVKLGDPLV